MKTFQLPSAEQDVPSAFLNEKGIRLTIKRDDLIHDEVSGNKWRKLKWNIDNALQSDRKTILTFGGAHSNHIAATAAAAQLHGLRSIGIIRGEEVDLNNPTLRKARENGMEIHRVSRSEFREIEDRDYIESLRHHFGPFYLIPQGGQNHYGVQGCSEIMSELTKDYDRIFVACGTATTLSGMALANKARAEIYGVSALKGGDFLIETVKYYVKKTFNDLETEEDILAKIHLITDSHFGGYAKIKPELIHFMRNFAEETGVKLDPVYTAKTGFAMFDFAKKIDLLKTENWLLIHSGGMQGIPAMEEREAIKIY
ncbi:pyridoxal-phosphate dependent enzyme [Cryomorphaceae bacterium 1068]|nr:pyridoxal-phosphate dependent enzyme [Cryomorphaceae bacterium 1068]